MTTTIYRLTPDQEHVLPSTTYVVTHGDPCAVLVYDNIVRALKSDAVVTLQSADGDTVVVDTSAPTMPPSTYPDLPPSDAPERLRRDLLLVADISTIQEVLAHGGKFYDRNGKQTSVYLLLRDAGFRVIRLRLWNRPYAADNTPYGGGNNDLRQDLAIAKVACALGFDILLDLHYSDFWADPASQRVPQDWADCKRCKQVEERIETYTRDTLLAFQNHGIPVRYVQIGNEITPGMLLHAPVPADRNTSQHSKKLRGFPTGKFGSRRFLKYLRAGLRGAKAACPDIVTILHIDRGGDARGATRFFRRVADLPYDMIGLSYYPFFHGPIQRLRETLRALAPLHKPVLVAETSYAFTNEAHAHLDSVFRNLPDNVKYYPVSPQGQADMLLEIADCLQSMPNNLGVGIAYWEPCWLPQYGAGWSADGTLSSWSDQGLFDYQGIALPSLYTFRSPHAQDASVSDPQ